MRSAFHALHVDSGEDTDPEEVIEVKSEAQHTQSPVPKLTKTAMKKAAKAARLERLKKSGKPPPSTDSESPDTGTPLPETVSPSEEPQPPLIPVLPLAEEVPPLQSSLPQNDEEHILPQPVSNNHVPDGQADAATLSTGPVSSEKAFLPIISNSGHFPTPHSQAINLVEPKAHASDADIEPAIPQSISNETLKKSQNVITRTIWTLIMIAMFVGLLLMGHAYMILLVMLTQSLVYREVTALFSLRSSGSGTEEVGGKDPWSKTLNWYFFAVTNYFLYGESIIYYFKHVVFADAQLLPFATNHRIISFTLYTIGFMGFVMSLKKGYLKQQFGLFCWVHMSLLMIVVSSQFTVNNILEGLIWFWVPASLVICNDVFAYIWGKTLGRTPLISLSPKKTVEGFVGAFFTTIVFSLIWGTYFMRFKYMTCPVHDLGVNAWSQVDCVPNPVFVWREWEIWPPVAKTLSGLLGRQVTTIPYVPYQFHLIAMSCFASLVAPFGGFFASGFKRAFNVKDFGDSIPGHGGMTDRMDCQFLMGVFTYVYYSSLIRVHKVSVGSILQTIVSGLRVEEQLEVIADLKKYLEGVGVKVPC